MMRTTLRLLFIVYYLNIIDNPGNHTLKGGVSSPEMPGLST